MNADILIAYVGQYYQYTVSEGSCHREAVLQPIWLGGQNERQDDMEGT